MQARAARGLIRGQCQEDKSEVGVVEDVGLFQEEEARRARKARALRVMRRVQMIDDHGAGRDRVT